MVQNNNITVNLHTLDDKVLVRATGRENAEVIIDYFSPIGTDKGFTSLELLMASFGSCVSTALLTLLRYRMKKSVDGLSVEIKGIVREEHPKKLEHILLLMKISAKDLTQAEVQEALKVAEDSMCPVWAMIRGNVTVEFEIEINSLHFNSLKIKV